MASAPLHYAPPPPPDPLDAEERRIAALIGRSDTPQVYRGCAWDHLEADTKAEREMHALLRNAAMVAGNEANDPLLIALVAPEGVAGSEFRGNNGTGKTLVCSIAALECCRRGTPGKCTPMIAMLERARLAAYDGVGPDGAERRPRSMEDVLRQDWVTGLPFLALDECDKGRGSDDEWLNVGRLVDRRMWLPGLVTVLCTNLTERELGARMGNSVMDRAAIVVACDWPSRRKRIGGRA